MGSAFPAVTQACLNAWEYVIPVLEFPDDVRRVIYGYERYRSAEPPAAQSDQGVQRRLAARLGENVLDLFCGLGAGRA